MAEMINMPRFREPKIVDRLKDETRGTITPRLSFAYTGVVYTPESSMTRSRVFDRVNRLIRNPMRTIQYAID